VFAVLITVLVLELRPPEFPTFNALGLLWPTWLSYAVSCLFIAIVWTNHHYLMRYADDATPRLLWFNFAHLFSISAVSDRVGSAGSALVRARAGMHSICAQRLDRIYRGRPPGRQVRRCARDAEEHQARHPERDRIGRTHLEQQCRQQS
jgi:hypothetical protein